jgi:hypothetical protein
MEPFEKLERKREAQQRLYAQRQRVGQLRSRAVAISLIAFVVLWGIVFTQMATGNDPVLGAHPANPALSERPAKVTAPRVASEEIETSDPEEFEEEVIEPPPIEEEAVELEPIEEEAVEPELELEPEPAPVITSQS